MIFLDQVPGSHRLRTVSPVGEVFPLTPTANGRAVLATMPQLAAGAHPYRHDDGSACQRLGSGGPRHEGHL